MKAENLSLKTNAGAASFEGSTLARHMVRALCIGLLCAGMAACEKKGPAERAGEKIDNAATDIGNAVEDKCEEAKENAGASDTRC